MDIYFLGHFFICMLIIFIYGSYRCKNPEYKDILEKRIGIDELDGWSISHFIFFIIIGYRFPQKEYLILAFFLGVSWEIFEHMYGKYRPGWLGGYGDCELKSDRESDGNWWYGKWSDILMNLLGLYCGYKFKKIYK